MSRLRIAEIFQSVQGEGLWLGSPSVFIRVSGCNLRCRWCDTPYASWHPEGDVMDIDAILAAAGTYGTRDIVLTGGEPMIFEPVGELTRRLTAIGHRITIETAGTALLDVTCDLMSISPKLAHSTPDGEWAERHERARLNFEVLNALAERYACQFKFVVNPESGADDLGEIEAILGAVPASERHPVVIMAEGTDAAVLHRRERLLVAACIERGWRLLPRFHVDLFGNTRGT